MIELIITGIVALIVGLVCGWLLASNRARTQQHEAEQLAVTDARQDASTARSDASRAREEAAQTRTELAKQEAEKSGLRTRVAEVEALMARAEAETHRARADTATAEAKVAKAIAERDAASARAKEIAEDRASLLDQFKLLSAESLESQGKKVDATADKRMKETEKLVTPLTDGLREMQQKIAEVEKERTRMSAEMREQINAIRSSGETLRKETLSLTNALRTPQVRGSWGEQSLKRMVEISGLTSRVDFDEQLGAVSGDGDRFRPDMRIHLAGSKVVFVDAKVPLAAVLDAYNTEDEAEQTRHLDRFARHVRKHIDDLSGKSYWALDVGSPEFVVLFLGSDEFYRLAQERMPDLHEYAARRNVMLASPGILIPMLHIVAHGWTQASLAESAAQVVRLGRELHDRLSTMGNHFDKMGRSLTSTVKAYNAGISSLERRVLVSSRRFVDLEVVKEPLAELSTIEDLPTAPSAPELVEADEAPAFESGDHPDEEAPG